MSTLNPFARIREFIRELVRAEIQGLMFHLRYGISPSDTISLEHLRNQQTQNHKDIMATQAEHAAALRGLKDQLTKAKGEIITKIAALEEAVRNAGATSPEVDAAFADLRGEVQTVDDMHPDAPPTEPPTT